DGDNLLTKEKLPYEETLFDDFSDGDYTSDPTWAAWTGSWAVSSGVLQGTTVSGNPQLAIANTALDKAVRLRYRLDNSSGKARVFLRYTTGGGDKASVDISTTQIKIVEAIGSTYTRATATVTSTQGQWYDLYARLNGSHMEIWRAAAGAKEEFILEADDLVSDTCTHFDLKAEGGCDVSFDDVQILEERTTAYSFTEDFDDGNYTGWSTSGTWSAASNYMENTVLSANWRYFNDDRAHDDGVLEFSYTLSSDSTAANPRAVVAFRRVSAGNNLLRLDLYESTAILRKCVGGTYTTLDSDATADSDLDQAYRVKVVMDGSDTEVWWGEEGGTLELILSGSQDDVLSGTHLWFYATTDTKARFDDIVLD
ncbi:MAG: hypothetical protein GY851_32155, partial [bacterium]|nr:hypothetical protein [bacterium]